MSGNPLEVIGTHKLVPVIALDSADLAEPLGDALVAGGLPIAEVTFRTEAAADAIAKLSARKDLLVGAGTVLSPYQVDQAAAAGASFIVSPGLNPRVVSRTLELGLTSCPGICTPSDIEQALELGLDVVKFFPAESFGGLATLKALAAPYKGVRFVPTGGIGPDNVCDYLAFAPVLACGGSWMVKPALYADGNFHQVEQAVREAVELVKRSHQ